jgi:hypothetical protein
VDAGRPDGADADEVEPCLVRDLRKHAMVASRILR